MKPGLLLLPLPYWLCVEEINVANMATNGKECKNKRHAREIHRPYLPDSVTLKSVSNRSCHVRESYCSRCRALHIFTYTVLTDLFGLLSCFHMLYWFIFRGNFFAIAHGSNEKYTSVRIVSRLRARR